MFEYRRNCSNKNFGMKENTLYLAVDILLEQNLCRPLMNTILGDSGGPVGVAAVAELDSSCNLSILIPPLVYIFKIPDFSILSVYRIPDCLISSVSQSQMAQFYRSHNPRWLNSIGFTILLTVPFQCFQFQHILVRVIQYFSSMLLIACIWYPLWH